MWQIAAHQDQVAIREVRDIAADLSFSGSATDKDQFYLRMVMPDVGFYIFIFIKMKTRKTAANIGFYRFERRIVMFHLD